MSDPLWRLREAFGEGNWKVLEGKDPYMIMARWGGRDRWFVGRTLEETITRAVAAAARVPA